MRAKQQPVVDAGIQEITDWHAWFLTGHTQRLADLHLPRDQHDRELATITAQATAIRERMTSDYLLNRSRQS